MARTPNARGEGDRLRDQLVDAASAMLLHPQGVAVPSLRAVARACDVSPSAVYLHFSSVQALVLAVIEQQYGTLRAEIGEAADGAAGRDAIAAAGIAYASWGLAHPGAYQLLFESADELGLDGGPLAGGPGWDLIEGLSSWVAAASAVSGESATLVAVRLWTALHGLVSLRLHKASHEWPSAVDDEVQALLALVPSA